MSRRHAAEKREVLPDAKFWSDLSDRRGKMMLPGFVDGHLHAVAGGVIANGVDLQTDDKAELIYDSAMDMARERAIHRPLFEIIPALGTVSVLVVGGVRVVDGAITNDEICQQFEHSSCDDSVSLK